MDINLTEYKPVWNKLNNMERVYIKYESNKNLPTHKNLIHNQIYKEVKATESNGFFTNEANQNLYPSQNSESYGTLEYKGL